MAHVRYHTPHLYLIDIHYDMNINLILISNADYGRF